MKTAIYLEAGVDTNALTIGRVKGEPFNNEVQAEICPVMFRGIWLYRPFTYPGHLYADVSKTFLAMQASTIRCLRLPAANYHKQARDVITILK